MFPHVSSSDYYEHSKYQNGSFLCELFWGQEFMRYIVTTVMSLWFDALDILQGSLSYTICLIYKQKDNSVET